MSTRQRSARDQFESGIETIDRLIRIVAQRHGLPETDVADFRSEVMLRLVDGDYRVIRTHAGRSELSTFLTATISNVAGDYRRRLWGRWKPSAAASRMGPVAVELEELVVRDRMPFRDAVPTLEDRYGSRVSADGLERLVAQLPMRARRRFCDASVLDRCSAPAAASAEAGVDRRRRLAVTRRTEAVLNQALLQMDPDDRELLRLRFLRGHTTAAIARGRRVDSQRLYRRLARCLGLLRAALQAAGLTAADARAIVGRAECSLELGALSPSRRAARTAATALVA